MEEKSEEDGRLEGGKAELKEDYYHANFKTILETVLRRNEHLLEKEELDLLEKLTQSEKEAQMLFVRLFERKGPWFKKKDIQYKEIKGSRSNLFQYFS